jgi:hypothetical protein
LVLASEFAPRFIWRLLVREARPVFDFHEAALGLPRLSSLFQTALPPLCRSVLAPPKSRRHSPGAEFLCCDFRPFFSAAAIRVFCLSQFRPQARRPVFGLRFPWLKLVTGRWLFSCVSSRDRAAITPRTPGLHRRPGSEFFLRARVRALVFSRSRRRSEFDSVELRYGSAAVHSVFFPTRYGSSPTHFCSCQSCARRR